MENSKHMKHITIGTAGHIDHGKTTLIKAVTGIETDTLEEEKQRGISINLGFTYFNLPSGRSVGIVDVPGHEKFIKNMLAGASGLDIVVLVVAADEGIMPQTVEHLDILSFLQIKNGIVVLTKCDAVDEEFIELAREDVKDGLKGTFLEGAEILEVDSVSKRGIPELVEKLDQLSAKTEEKNINSPARLNIDRVFSVKGFGTVVTGTMIEGEVSVDDELEIYPKGKIVKIRGIQVHKKSVEKAFAGQRTAINLSNIKVDEIERGDVLAAPNSLIDSMMIDVKIKMLNHMDFTLENWDRLRFYHGTREIMCRAVPIDKEFIKPGEEGYVQLRLEEKLVCKKGDPFVVRTYSPMYTIGGGTIIDTSTEKHRNGKYAQNVVSQLKVKEKGSLEDIIAAFLQKHSYEYPTIAEIMSYSGASKEDVEKNIEILKQKNIVVKINKYDLHREYFNVLQDKLLESLEAFHKRCRLKDGMKKQEAGSKVALEFKAKDIDAFLSLVAENKLIKLKDGLVSKIDFEVKYNEIQLKIKTDLINKMDKVGLDDIYKKDDLSKKDKNIEEVLDSMIGKEAISLGDDYLISINIYEKAKKILIDYLEKNKEITLAQYRDLVGSSRKICMLVLESFDVAGITRRVENKRVLA